ncbi:MAG: baseplate J/gp47 family protein, partial [Dysosmobacter sp.]|nr:baseplate J/gp47 family protein [Dysosmobacter sp.]
MNVYLTAPAGVPSQALLAEVEADLAARREIAVDVKALAPTTAAVNVAAAVKPEAERSFAEVKAAVEEALRRHFTGTLLGKGVFLAELGSLIYQVDGVANCRLTAPAADLAAV